MGDVHRLETDWHGPLEVQEVIEAAKTIGYDHVLIIGWQDGDVTGQSDFAAKADILWLIEKFKADLLAGRW